jgi:hypothetical protein
MSKETFWQSLEKESVYTMLDAEKFIDLIEAHGGRVVWPLPTPEGQGCTCHSKLAWLDYDKYGPWHGPQCAMYDAE